MPAAVTVPADLYYEVQHFYARQIQALDGGRWEQFAATFTEDGTFQHVRDAPPARTRAGILTEVERFHERFAHDPVQRRHWFNHMVLDPQPDGSIRSTVYALVVTTRPGGRPEIQPSSLVHDVLVREGGELLTRSRRITHDHEPRVADPAKSTSGHDEMNNGRNEYSKL